MTGNVSRPITTRHLLWKSRGSSDRATGSSVLSRPQQIRCEYNKIPDIEVKVPLRRSSQRHAARTQAKGGVVLGCISRCFTPIKIVFIQHGRHVPASAHMEYARRSMASHRNACRECSPWKWPYGHRRTSPCNLCSCNICRSSYGKSCSACCRDGYQVQRFFAQLPFGLPWQVSDPQN